MGDHVQSQDQQREAGGGPERRERNVAKVKYDVSHVEASQFKQPSPGLYTMKVEEANYRNTDGKNDIELVLVVVGGEFDGAKLWTYVGLSESAEWKMKELADALCLPA